MRSLVFILFHICNKTYTKRDEADDAVDGRVCAFPEKRQANYPNKHAKYPELPPKYPQDGRELPAGNVDGVHDAVVPVDGHCV